MAIGCRMKPRHQKAHQTTKAPAPFHDWSRVRYWLPAAMVGRHVWDCNTGSTSGQHATIPQHATARSTILQTSSNPSSHKQAFCKALQGFWLLRSLVAVLDSQTQLARQQRREEIQQTFFKRAAGQKRALVLNPPAQSTVPDCITFAVMDSELSDTSSDMYQHAHV